MTKQTPYSEARLSQRLGLDAQARQDRVALMGLSEADIPILHKVQQHAIKPRCQHIVERFYAFLLSFPEMHKFLGGPEHIQHVQTLQIEYLCHFGEDFGDIAYFEYRLRIGIAHERLGMPLHLYLAAYRAMQALIQEALPDSIREHPQDFAAAANSISKIVMLDISLAIDAYTRNRVELMSESLQALAHERDTLSNQLMHDTLTGTLSRRFILETLNKQLAQLTRQPGRSLNVALMDLDHFKVVNDTHGHLVGDKVLYEFSRVVSNRVREQDYFGRFGGEEFLLILTEIPANEAFNVLNRICEATRLQIFTHEGKHIPLTVSIGFTTARPTDKVDDLIERADNALYQAKQAGRDRVTSL